MQWFKKFSYSGVEFANDYSERRNIIISNNIALVIALIPIVLLTIRLSLGMTDLSISVQLAMLFASPFFCIPIWLNRLGFIYSARFFLAIVPSWLIILINIFGLYSASVYTVADLVGVRFFFLATSVIPFFIFDLQKWKLLLPAIVGNILPLIFFDPILDFFGVGYQQMVNNDPFYYFNNVRVYVTITVIASCFYLMKRVLEKNERLNSRLINELHEKNTIIQNQARGELNKLNAALELNIEKLKERELILNESQKVAKVGSWDYNRESGLVFWSDEMYNIFDIDKDFVLKSSSLSSLFNPERTEILNDAIREVLEQGTPFELLLDSRNPFGYLKWFRVTGFPTYENNRIIGVRGICHDITLFKEAEFRLKSSQARFSTAFEFNPDFIMIVRESDLMVLDVNPRITDILGFDRDEVIGKSARYMDLFLTEEERQRYINSYSNSGYTIFECPWKRKDGKLIHAKITGIRIEIENVKYRMSVVQDVTAQRAAEEKFSKAFNLNPDLMLIIRERDFVIIDANQKLKSMIGFEPHEVIGTTMDREELKIWTDAKARDWFLARYYNTGYVSQEARIFRRTGEKFYAFISAQQINLFDENHMIVVVSDINTQKETEKQFMLSQANLTATINNTQVMIWSVDHEFRLLSYNIPFYNYVLKYYGKLLVVGERILKRTNHSEWDELSKRWESHYIQALAGQLITIEESRFGMDFQYSLSPIIENKKISGVSVFADNITEQKKKERELAEANKQIGEMKLMALRSVMNPHFIFNALNSIQYFIINNDKLNAINYLSTFSKLIRSILNHSVGNIITLTEELELLKYYIQLEQTRFENKFDFEFDIDAKLDLDNIHIPSLLVQPYVENAILHGLYNKNDTGKLIVRAYEKDRAIIFEIEDNGIGRKAAAEIRQKSFSGHKSMGIKVTEERLKLINQNRNVSVNIIDLMNENIPAGTRVIIWVALDE